ncbi:hypothetical protein CKA32_001828 [Geitlerinema sp. FC II]|nr:hypothetical protein CKA32_001828 [Geitlerinema sp. FC II]
MVLNDSFHLPVPVTFPTDNAGRFVSEYELLLFCILPQGNCNNLNGSIEFCGKSVSRRCRPRRSRFADRESENAPRMCGRGAARRPRQSADFGLHQPPGDPSSRRKTSRTPFVVAGRDNATPDRIRANTRRRGTPQRRRSLRVRTGRRRNGRFNRSWNSRRSSSWYHVGNRRPRLRWNSSDPPRLQLVGDVRNGSRKRGEIPSPGELGGDRPRVGNDRRLHGRSQFSPYCRSPSRRWKIPRHARCLNSVGNSPRSRGTHRNPRLDRRSHGRNRF